MKTADSIASMLGCCLLLAACGGGSSTTSATISGTLSGWSSSPSMTPLLLGNAGAETIAVNVDGAFSFAKRVPEGSSYKVTVLSHLNGANCEVTGGTGTVTHNMDSVSNVSVKCVTKDVVSLPWANFDVGVTVSGLLPGNSVTLMNNGNETLTASENGLFVFPGGYITAAAYEGRAAGYDVTVKTEPTNQVCTVSNGTGALHLAVQGTFVNIPVSCK